MARKYEVIVLNASFEVLSVVPLNKALTYVYKEQVDVLIVDDEDPRSGMSAPRVVKFRDFIETEATTTHRILAWSRKMLLQRDNYTCGYCGRTGKTVDHIVPQAHGGKSTWSNTVAACNRCNNIKADRTPEQAGMVLQINPRTVFHREVLVRMVKRTGVDLQLPELAAVTIP